MTGVITATARVLAKHRLAALRGLAGSPAQAQEALLRRFVRSARDTWFGRQHGFGSIRTVRDYQRAVGLRQYADLDPYWMEARAGRENVCWPGKIEHFALSSGTTRGEKYLPISRDTIRTNRQGGWDSMVPYLAQRKSADLFAGRILFLGGSTTLRREGAAWIGDNTGIMARHIPFLLRRFHSPGYGVASETVWERKVVAAARRALHHDVRMMSGVPSWLILFAEEVLRCARESRRSVRTLHDVWPKLDLLIHGGVTFGPYRDRMVHLLGKEIWFTDTYSASEGGMLAVQDLPDQHGMLPLVDRGAFMEFVPLAELDKSDPERVPLARVDLNVDYAVVLTTNAGIWSYLVGDVVRFVTRDPLRLVFSGRTAHTLNAFGEHVSSGELDRAVTTAARQFGFTLLEYAVAARFPGTLSPRGAHVYYLEIDAGVRNFREESVAREIDRVISEGNEDYAAHRASGFGLDLPEVRAVPPGTFLRWMASRGKLGGQHKVPRVLSPELERDFEQVCGAGVA